MTEILRLLGSAKIRISVGLVTCISLRIHAKIVKVDIYRMKLIYMYCNSSIMFSKDNYDLIYYVTQESSADERPRNVAE